MIDSPGDPPPGSGEPAMAAPKILVADDDKQLLPMLALHLRNEEYEVACAEDGAGAVEVARREKPDLLVLDVSLPTSDGLSMPEYLATKPDLMGIPVIYLAMERSGKGLAGGYAPICGVSATDRAGQPH